jgi:hypothetical protein
MTGETMSEHHEEKEPAFKVVDKRRFTDEGEAKDQEAHEHAECCDMDHGHPHGEMPKGAEKANEKVRMDMDFSLFIQSLAHQAMMGLGMVPWPDSGLIRKEPRLAQQTIDILLILKEKTKGNLSVQEQMLVDGILYQLQLAFVELSKMPDAPSTEGSILK